GTDVRAQQHPAVYIQRDLHLQRHARAQLTEEPADADHLRAHLEDVLRRLDQQDVDATLDQTARLLRENVHQLRERDVAERGIRSTGKVARRTDRARDETRS